MSNFVHEEVNTNTDAIVPVIWIPLLNRRWRFLSNRLSRGLDWYLLLLKKGPLSCLVEGLLVILGNSIILLRCRVISFPTEQRISWFTNTHAKC